MKQINIKQIKPYKKTSNKTNHKCKNRESLCCVESQRIKNRFLTRIVFYAINKTEPT